MEPHLRSLKRGLEALQQMNLVQAMTIAEMARRLDLPRTTAERILKTLEQEGYIERVIGARGYKITSRVCSLARGFQDDSWITRVASPMLFETTAQIGWPLAIARPRGENMAVQVATDSKTSMSLHRRYAGSEIPLMLASSGLCFLAFSNPVQRELLLTLARRSSNPSQASARNKAALQRTLDSIVRQGYAFAPHGGKERSIALPIIVNGEIQAVLLMAFMTQAITDSAVVRQYLPQLSDLAKRIASKVNAAKESETGRVLQPARSRKEAFTRF